jgi:kynureninase
MTPTHDPAPLDAADPLAPFVERFLPADDVVAYLDGNSLGKPLRATLGRLDAFVRRDWGSRLIRAWDEQWMELPLAIGDRLGAATLGAAAGQTTIGDSTTVLLYKTIRAALDAGAGDGRDEIVLDDDQFPTDRFVIEGIARERGATIRWIPVDPALGVTPELVRKAVGPRTAVVVVNHVSYRSGYLADMPGITRIVHDAGALVVWDLCHSTGVVPMRLDEWDVDLAVGCTYKYLNGGPGSPAFVYVASRHQQSLRQPIQGWMGAADVFAMAPAYEASPGIRGFLSGTPPILGMLALQDMLDAIEQAGVDRIRAKSVALTEYALALVDDLLAPLGVAVATPRDRRIRGSHVTVTHPAFREIVEVLWQGGVIPDFRNPDGLRIGLSPLSTSFAEVRVGIEAVHDALVARDGGESA